jgi:thiamine pyrophosphokinase
MKALIVLHGDRSPLQELSIWADGSEIIIAGDGGADYCLASGITPDHVVGDMDGISSLTLNRIGPERVSRNPDQETTDAQKALGKATELGAQDIVVFGAEGTRIDHTLSCLNCAAATGVPRIRVVFEFAIAHAVMPKAATKLETRPGLNISLMPLLPTEVTLGHGLMWPAGGLLLSPLGKDGISNVALGESIDLEISTGCLIVFVGRFEGDIAW